MSIQIVCPYFNWTIYLFYCGVLKCSLYTGRPHFIALHFIVLHRYCGFYKLKGVATPCCQVRVSIF